MQTTNPSDLSFYALVHHVLEASREDDDTLERRTGRRRRFSCLQFVAPYRDGRLPSPEEFEQVQCVDLSPGGFSFLAEDDAPYEYLIVALGSPKTHFVSAEVVRRGVVSFEGRNRLRIGCRFIARIEDANYRPRLA